MSLGAIEGATLPIAVIPKPEPVPDLLQVVGDDAGLGHALAGEVVHGLAAQAGQVILMGATCLGAAALAVVVTRGAVAATEALAQGLDRLDRELAQREKCHGDACRAAQLWQDAATQAVDVNARIAAFRAAVRREFGPDGGDPDLPQPPPLELGGRSLQEVYEECTRRRDELDRGWELLNRKAAAAADRRLALSLPRVDRSLLPTAEELLERRRRKAAPAVGEAPGSPSGTGDLDRIQAEIDGQLARLGPGLTDAEHARLLQTAAKALARGSERAARPQLDMLERQVSQLVTRAIHRREHAEAAAKALEGIDFLRRRRELEDSDRVVVRALEAVVDGGGLFDGPLRESARKLCERAERRAVQLHQSERIAALLTELGYEVREGAPAVHDLASTFHAAKPGWTGHQVSLFVTGEGASGIVVRDGPTVGDDAARQDRQRCAEWAADSERLADRLREEGIEPRTLRISASEPVQHSGKRTDEPSPADAHGHQQGQQAREQEL